MTTTVFPELAPPPQPARPRVVMIATVAASAAVVMAFAGMLALYLRSRAAALAEGDSWLPDGAEMPLTPANMAAITLAMSVVIMQWAVYSIGNDDRRNTYVALGLTVLLGGAYINEIAFYYTQMGDLTVHTPVGLLIFGISGAHLVLTGVAMLFVCLVAFRTLGGQYSGRDREGIAAAALFWYVMVAVYAAIWVAIFITK